MVFGWFPWFFKVVSWFHMVFGWFPWFFKLVSLFLMVFSWFPWIFKLVLWFPHHKTVSWPDYPVQASPAVGRPWPSYIQIIKISKFNSCNLCFHVESCLLELLIRTVSKNKRMFFFCVHKASDPPSSPLRQQTRVSVQNAQIFCLELNLRCLNRFYTAQSHPYLYHHFVLGHMGSLPTVTLHPPPDLRQKSHFKYTRT